MSLRQRAATQTILDVPVCLRILRLAGPLILSMTGVLLMQITDGVLLSWHSPEAIAAIGPAGMSSFLLSSIFLGATGYVSTLVAQYFGAQQPERIGSAVWQGIYFAVVAGCLAACLAPLGRSLFALVGHAPLVQRYETIYFQVMCAGMPVVLLASALSGFFTGRGDNKRLMRVQLVGLALNAVFTYLLIFGKLGFPAWGVGGAALATVLSQAVVAAALAVRLSRRDFLTRYAIWRDRRFDPEMMGRLIRFGLPGGLRFATEILAWTVFLFFIGRVGTTELASTSIAWRLNGVAFFPIVGLSEAIRTLVGQAQGRRDPATSVHVTFQGLLMAEAWMIAAGVLFLCFPRPLYFLFQGGQADAAAAFGPVMELGVVLLRFVAAYCLLDAFNIVLMGSLMAAGDTRWTLWVSLLLHAVFIAALAYADHARLGVFAEWSIATFFVMVVALVWLYRFRSGAWKHIRVIDAGPEETKRLEPG
jgi:MATE family multidrug resistance protein